MLSHSAALCTRLCCVPQWQISLHWVMTEQRAVRVFSFPRCLSDLAESDLFTYRKGSRRTRYSPDWNLWINRLPHYSAVETASPIHHSLKHVDVFALNCTFLVVSCWYIFISWKYVWKLKFIPSYWLIAGLVPPSCCYDSSVPTQNWTASFSRKKVIKLSC